MSIPLITPADLAVSLNDPGIDVARATLMIARAQTLCESHIAPLPAGADVVVDRVAGRAYTSTLSPRQVAARAAGGQFMGQQGGGVYLTRSDKADLRRLAKGGGAFSVNLLPTGYVAPASQHFGEYGAPATDWDMPA